VNEVHVLAIVSKAEAEAWLDEEGPQPEEVVITRHGRPAGVLIGFGSEEEWFDYRLERHPEVLDRIREAGADIAAGRGIRIEDVSR
jgi:PHD/YefM family antitoxin component YafN of YafNO toxin-antitoxin module